MIHSERERGDEESVLREEKACFDGKDAGRAMKHPILKIMQSMISSSSITCLIPCLEICLVIGPVILSDEWINACSGVMPCLM